MASSPSAARWMCASDAIDWRQWDGELVVRVASTASTHLLDPAAGAVFRHLLDAGRPLTAAELDRCLFEHSTPDGVAPLPPDSARILRELERIGVATPLP